MIFRKYHIVVFKDRQGQCRKLQLRGWLPITVGLALTALLAVNVYLFKYYREYSTVEHSLSLSEKTVHDQNMQLMTLHQKMQALEKDLSRVSEFDARLRDMISLKPPKEEARPASTGGSPEPDFAKNYLPFHRQELLARKLNAYLGQLTQDTKLEKARQEELFQLVKANQGILESMPSMLPANGWISSGFGPRVSQFTGKEEEHLGVDISCLAGTPVQAPAPGRVIFAGWDDSFGWTVILSHGFGLTTRYSHMKNQAVKIKTGQPVARGEQIGEVGATGRTTGPHLHYEVRLSGVPVNPMRYIIS